ncbi:hypothetical protein ABFS83_10G150600 [Erythranthe nasuta]
MAYNNYPSARYALLLTAAFLFAAATNPLADGQVVTLLPIRPIGGSLCCTATGNCPGGQPIPGVTINVTCNILGLGSRVIGRGTTNVNGTFNISTFPVITGLIFGLPSLPCVATVQLPLLSSVVCPLLNTTGILVSALSPGPLINPAFGWFPNFGALMGFVNVRTT